MKRIVSLVPSLTHMLCDFGLESEIVGCTTFCVDPPHLRHSAQDIGGTKNPDLDQIATLKPTHILVNQEENKPEHIQACEAMAPTFSTFPKSPTDVPDLLREVGAWLGIPEVGQGWAQKVQESLDQIEAHRKTIALGVKSYLYLIWREPYMVAAENTYIAAMLGLLGLTNAAGPGSDRYPALTLAEMQERSPDVLFLSSEPYPFRRRDMERLAKSWRETHSASAPLPRLEKVDGKLLSWYGTMTVEGLRYLEALGRTLGAGGDQDPPRLK